MPEHHAETMNRTTNNDLSFATNVRAKNAGYEMRHRRVRITMREKLGLSKPRNGGFDRGGDSSAYWPFVVEGGKDGRAGSSAPNALLFGAKRE